jgi:hypothetical protein
VKVENKIINYKKVQAANCPFGKILRYTQ